MAVLIVLKVIEGFVDEQGRVWLPGMALHTTPGNADKLVAEGKCERTEAEAQKTKAPFLNKETDK